MCDNIPTADQVYHFAVYGTLRDDCDQYSKQDWTTKFCQDMSATPRSAHVLGMKLFYKKSITEDWPYAMPTDNNNNDYVVVRIIEFKPNWIPKLQEADGVEQYDPEQPDASPLGYKRQVVEAILLDDNGNRTNEIVYAVMYFISKLEDNVQYYHIETGDWIQRDISYHHHKQEEEQQHIHHQQQQQQHSPKSDITLESNYTSAVSVEQV